MHYLFRIFFSTLLFIYGTSVYADKAAALDAQARGDFTRAAQEWLLMARGGDPVAQYNLALLYQKGTGVAQDNTQYRYWLVRAARRGMVNAYHQLSTESIRPTSQRSVVKTGLSPMEWVAEQNPGYYTLQLASSTNEELIKKYYNENQLEGKAGYYRSLREGEHWYALVYGTYPSVNDAKAAIADLPENLKKWSPWVRNIKSIHRLMVR